MTPAQDVPQPLAPLTMRELFGEGGRLSKLLDGYEERPEQLDFAESVAAAVATGGKLLAEAGTGTGKTLAYLAPVLTNGTRAVVSTATKNLQEQILTKDLPLLERALEQTIAVQLMKGRTNYLCITRAERVWQQGTLPGHPSRQRLDTVRAWGEMTQTGDRAELASLPDDSELWSDLTATSEQCTGRKCREFERCWVTQMRRRAQQARLVIVNHHLYFADVALRGRVHQGAASLLPPHDLVVFDEAHELSEVAAQHFGFTVSEKRIRELGRDVTRAAAADRDLSLRLSPALGELDLRAQQLMDLLPLNGGRQPLRQASLSDALYFRHRTLDALLEGVESDLVDAAIEQGRPLARRTALIAAELAFILKAPKRSALAEELTLSALGPEGPSEPRVVPLDEVEAPPLADDKLAYVHYAEARGRARLLAARPIDVAPILERALAATPTICVSAALRVGQSFVHIRQRLGMADAGEIAVESPFDYQKQARLYLPDDLPEPNASDFADRAAERVVSLAQASHGGAFVLCTSYRMLSIMRAALEAETSLPVISQGDGPKSKILEHFAEHGDAVLVGTLSFWTGVDVPGDALRLVVMDKLPFASPGDPIVAATIEHMRARGREPFRRFQLPHAALLLRQGFGRLIRRRTDRGLVAILDRRMTTRGYGKLLLRSLPPAPVVTHLADATAFLSSATA